LEGTNVGNLFLVSKFNQNISKSSQIYTRKKKFQHFSISLLANGEISIEEEKTPKGTPYIPLRKDPLRKEKG
jgi:hypothetical protein